VADSPFARQTGVSTARAIHNLAKVLLTLAPDPKEIARRLEIPTISHAILAADSVGWLASHAPTPLERIVASP
jgi:hypothetical protein